MTTTLRALLGLVEATAGTATVLGGAAGNHHRRPSGGVDALRALGVGVGALIRNQLTGVLVAAAGIQLAEQFLGVVVPGQFLPTGAAGLLAGMTPDPGMPVWAGAGVLGAYAATTVGAALRMVVPRDIT